jgi:hypothetical protein
VFRSLRLAVHAVRAAKALGRESEDEDATGQQDGAA